MTELKTKSSLLKKLEVAATRPQTAEDVYRQRVSFIMGMLKDSSTVTREKISKVLAAQEGKKSA